MEENRQTISVYIPLKKLLTRFEISYNAVAQRSNRFNFRLSQFRQRLNFQSLKFQKKFFQYLLGIIIIVLILVAGVKIIDSIFSNKQSLSQTLGKSSEIKIADPLSTEKLNKGFKFSLRDDNGKEIATFAYTIESAELRKEILVKGQKATAISGRIFLVINLKIVNTLKQGITVNTKDYIRLSVNNNKELLAPDIHNDPVDVQAISTKYTRVGFAINESDRNLTLQVGEIDGRKETIKLSFK